MKKIVTFLVLFLSITMFAQSKRIKPDKVERKTTNTKALAELKAGVASYKAGNFAQAKTSFKKSISIDPNYTEAYLNLARVYEKQDSLVQANKFYSSAINSNVSAPRAYYDRGKLNLRQADYNAAARDFKSATALYSKNPSYNYYYAISLYKTGDYETAIKQFDQVIEKKPDHLYAYNDRGAAHLKLGHLELAQKDFDKSIELNKDFYVTYINQGKLSLSKQEPEKAIEAFNTCLKLKPNHISAINGLGIAHMQLGDLEVSEKQFSKAIELNSKIAVSYINLSSLYIKKDLYKEAISNCDKALALNKNSQKAFYNRGIAKEMIRDEKGACEDWETAFSLGSLDAEKYLNSAVCNQ